MARISKDDMKEDKKKNKTFNVLARSGNRKKLAKYEERFTIVRGLASFIKESPISHLVQAKIEKDVLNTSQLSIEASYMVNFYYTGILKRDPN